MGPLILQPALGAVLKGDARELGSFAQSLELWTHLGEPPLGLSRGYGRIGELGLGAAIARSASCALLILAFSDQLNRSGFRLRL